jgi:hypothetical protein
LNPVVGKVHVHYCDISGSLTGHNSDSMQERLESTHLEKRFRMRPAGVVSKKVMGDLKIA